MAASPLEQAEEQAEEPSLFPDTQPSKNGARIKKARSKKAPAAKKTAAKKAPAKRSKPAAKKAEKPKRGGRKVRSRNKNGINRYDGLRDNLATFFATHPGEKFTTSAVSAEFPEVPATSVGWHLREMVKKRMLVGSNNGPHTRTVFALASKAHRAARTETPEPAHAPLAIVSPVRRANPAKLDLFASRQLESILLRMENANDSATPLFTPFDIEFLRRLATR